MKSAFLAASFAVCFCSHAADQQSWDVRGVVKEVRTERKEIVIKHEDIPGYMEAMTMPFSVRDAHVLDGAAAGDTVKFHLVVQGDDGWIESIAVLSKSPMKQAAAPMAPLRVSDSLPALQLTDETGQPLQLASYRGKALALTFIFTRCPFPTMCPLLSAKFSEVQRKLATDPFQNWQLLSVTIDPARDTPEVLRAYAELHHASPGHWRMATGQLHEITKLALSCGVNFWAENGLLKHNLRTIVFDAQGAVRKIYTDNQWTADDLVRELRAGSNSK